LHSDKSPSDVFRTLLGDIDEIRTPNSETLELFLKRPNYLLPATLSSIGIMPATPLPSPRNVGQQLAFPAGTGPLYIREIIEDKRIILERSPRYWGIPSTLERIEARVIPDPSRALASLRNGEIHILPSLHPFYFPEQIDTPALRQRIMLFNFRRGPLKDRRLRQALTHLMDIKQLIQEARHQVGIPLSGPFSLQSTWYHQALAPLGYDREAAMRLIDAAGWVMSSKRGLRRLNGIPLTLRILWAKNSPEMKFAAHHLISELKNLGIDAQAKPADFGFVKILLQRGDFDIALLGIALKPYEDLSPWIYSGAPLNYGAYSNVFLNSLLDNLRTERDLKAQIRIAHRIHRVMRDDPPFSVLYAPVEIAAVSSTVSGFVDQGSWPNLAGLSILPVRAHRLSK